MFLGDDRVAMLLRESGSIRVRKQAEGSYTLLRSFTMKGMSSMGKQMVRG